MCDSYQMWDLLVVAESVLMFGQVCRLVKVSPNWAASHVLCHSPVGGSRGPRERQSVSAQVLWRPGLEVDIPCYFCHIPCHISAKARRESNSEQRGRTLPKMRMWWRGVGVGRNIAAIINPAPSSNVPPHCQSCPENNRMIKTLGSADLQSNLLLCLCLGKLLNLHSELGFLTCKMRTIIISPP